MNEKELIERCSKNDRVAQEFLYRKYYQMVYGMAMRYTKDDDYLITIVNNSFLKVFKSIGSFEFKGSFEGWIRKVSFHSLSDFFRKENKTKFWKNEIKKEAPFNDTVIADLYYADLLDVVNKLPEINCKVFTFYAIEGYSHKEISEMMDIPEGTSKWHLSNARKELKALLKLENKNKKHA